MCKTLSPNDMQAWILLMRTGSRMLAAVEADLKAKNFPPLTWYDVLLELRKAEGKRLRQVELQDKVLIAQYNMSRLIDRLAGAGYVEKERPANDRRGSCVVLTESGEDLLQAMWPVYQAAVAKHFSGKLDVAELVQLSKTLGKILDD